jgi:hypothetical protein
MQRRKFRANPESFRGWSRYAEESHENRINCRAEASAQAEDGCRSKGEGEKPFQLETDLSSSLSNTGRNKK